MKKFFFTLVLVFFVSFYAMSQTPMYYNSNTGTSSNSFPFNMPAGKATNYLYLAGEFNLPSPCPSGKAITTVYFRTSGAGTRTFQNLQILLAQDSTITTLTSGVFYAGPYDTVYFQDTTTLTSTIGGWMAVTLKHPYPYNPAKALILFAGQCGYTGTGATIYNGSASGIRRVWSVGGCPFAPYASGDVSWLNFGFDVQDIVVPGTWSEQTTGTANSLYSVSVVDDNIAWIGGASGKVYRTINSGVNWVDKSGNLPTTNPFYAIFAYSATTCIAVTSPSTGGSANVWQTNNGGTNWTNVYSYTGSAAFGDAVWMTDSLTEYYMGDPQGGNWDLKKSTNGGANWATWATVPTTASGGWNNGMFWYDANNVWFGTNAAFLMYSSNAGVNWSQQTTPTTDQYFVWFNSLTNGMSGSDANTFGTTNGGTNWTSITPPPFTTIYGGLCGSGSQFWACPQALTIYYTSNNGANWTLQFTSTTAGVIYDMSRARTGSVIFAVKSNGTICRYGPSLTGITPIGNITPAQYNLSQNYPNPFNPTTKIDFSLPKSGMVTLKVYNILGQEVNTLINEVKSAGTYSVDFNGTKFASGIYFYTIKSGDFTATKRMTLIK